MTQADGREVLGPHGASDALGHNPKIFRLALTQLSINRHYAHPMKGDVKEKSFSPPL
jgi:hypothetical protein